MPPTALVILLLTIALPLVELALLIKAGQLLGFWLLLAIVLTTATAGIWLLQEQGLSGMRRISEAVRQGKTPLESMLHGSLLTVAAFCLIAPGLITDTLGLLLLLPPIRHYAARSIHDWMTGMATPPASPPDARSQHPHGETPPHRPREPRGEPPVIDGEFERLDERPIDPHGKNDRKP